MRGRCDIAQDDTSHLPLLHKGIRVESCLPCGTAGRSRNSRIDDGTLGVVSRTRYPNKTSLLNLHKESAGATRLTRCVAGPVDVEEKVPIIRSGHVHPFRLQPTSNVRPWLKLFFCRRNTTTSPTEVSHDELCHYLPDLPNSKSLQA